MDVQKVKAMFDDSRNYLDGNTSIATRVTLLQDLVHGVRIRNYIELGCGDGSIALSLLDQSRRAVLVDFSSNMIVRAKENTPEPLRHRVDYVVSDLYSYDTQEKFDLVICVGVLAHVESIEAAVDKLGSLLAKGGHLLLQFTESRSLFGFIAHHLMRGSQGGYVVNRISRRTLFPLLSRNNFTVLKQKTYSDSSFGLGRLSPRLGHVFKNLTAASNLPILFSEVMILAQYAPR